MFDAGSGKGRAVMSEKSTRKKRHRPKWGKLLAGALVIAALAATWRYTPLSEYLTGERISAWAQAVRGMPSAPIWTALAYILSSYVMFPRPVLTLFTVIAFGPWLGFTYSMAGIMLAALSHYYVGRALPSDTVARLAGSKMDKVTEGLKGHGFLAIFAIRVVPVAPFPVEGIIAGAARIKVWDYSLGTFLGMLPGVLATTVFGREIERALKDPSKINYWVVGAVIVVFVLMTYFVGRWFAKQQAQPAGT